MMRKIIASAGSLLPWGTKGHKTGLEHPVLDSYIFSLISGFDGIEFGPTYPPSELDNLYDDLEKIAEGRLETKHPYLKDRLDSVADKAQDPTITMHAYFPPNIIEGNGHITNPAYGVGPEGYALKNRNVLLGMRNAGMILDDKLKIVSFHAGIILDDELKKDEAIENSINFFSYARRIFGDIDIACETIPDPGISWPFEPEEFYQLIEAVPGIHSLIDIEHVYQSVPDHIKHIGNMIDTCSEIHTVGARREYFVKSGGAKYHHPLEEGDETIRALSIYKDLLPEVITLEATTYNMLPKATRKNLFGEGANFSNATENYLKGQLKLIKDTIRTSLS